MRPLPARIGRYQVVRQLGEGGMGVVYEAHDPQLGRAVAIKQVLARGADERALERFRREAEVLARVQHPCVVRVHELGEGPDGPYLVQELVSGQTLTKHAAGRPLAPHLAARLVRDLADALEAVHALGSLHRDVKPHNVMLRADGSPVLLDFGLVRDARAERLTRTGELLGTIGYMAPEQAAGDSTTQLDRRVDVYGAGAVLYELLVGEPPFAGSGFETVVKILRDDPVWPATLRPELPPALDAICRRALAKQPADRYPTAAALRDDLARFLAAAPTRAEVHAVAASRGAARRRALAAVAALAVLGAGATATWLARRPDPAPAVAAPPPEAGAAHGSPTPTPALAASDTPTAPGPLWVVAPGTTLRYELSVDQTVPMPNLALSSTLRMIAGYPGSDGAVPFDCVLEDMRCSFTSDLSAGSLRFDAESVGDEQHPLAMLQAAVGLPFQVAIDPASGRVVRFDGFAPITRAVLAAPAGDFSFVATRSTINDVLARALDQASIRACVNALTHVRGEHLTVPWRSVEADGYAPTRDVERPAVLDNLTHGKARAGATCTFEGQVRYEGGSLREAQVEQRGAGFELVTTLRMIRR